MRDGSMQLEGKETRYKKQINNSQKEKLERR